MAEYHDNDLDYLPEDHFDRGYFDHFDDDEFDWGDQQGDEHGSRLEIESWERLNQSREYYSEMRLKMYKNYENSLGPHGELEQGKTYIVFVGRKPGIYDTWIEAANNVNGFKGAIHQSFKSRKEAENAFQTNLDNTFPPTSFTSSGSKNLSVPSSSPSSSKLKDALEEIKQQLDSVTLNDDD